MNRTNIDCVGQDELRKVAYTPFGVQSQTRDCK